MPTSTIENLDLLSVGLAIAAIGILGFIVFFTNRKSITNQAFLLFSLITIFWGVANYANYQISDPQYVLLFLRLLIALAVLHAFTFFQLAYVFPSENIKFPRWYKFILFPAAIASFLVNLSPLSFTRISKLAATAGISTVEKGPGMLLFAVLVLFSIVGGITLFIKKWRLSTGVARKQFRLIVSGTGITFALLFTFNFFLPAAFDQLRYMPLGAVFIFPFIGFTAYAIFKYHLLNIKVIATEILTFALAVASLVEIVFSNTTAQTILRCGIFVLVLGIGIMLIRSVRREVEQREELGKLNQEVGEANVQLTSLNRQKSEFLRFASHDLKSPVGLIKQWATLIDDGTYAEPAKIHETLKKIKATADRSIQSVDDLLDVNKLEEGRMDYDFEVKDIVSFVRGITEDYAPLAKAQKDIAVTFDSPIASANVKMDTTRLRQVIQNLIGNSFKYSEKGWIKVSITEEQKSVLITVKDSGLGMSKELLPILFEQFRRDPSVAKKIQGTGLGLYISKLFTVAHSGEIWAESEGPGFGSSFFVRLPKA